jgi:type IV pilus assembly protein PilW
MGLLMNAHRGFTLIEMLIAMVISLVVAAAMTNLMANTLGTSSRTIGMTRVTQEARTALQLMSRDVRRAGYSSEAVQCYANVDCFTDGSVTLPGAISINVGNDCFIFQHDRDHDGDGTNDGAGGFRRGTIDGVGVLEMWAGNNAPSCTAASDDWIEITDPEVVDVYLFWIGDSPQTPGDPVLSYTEVINIDPDGNDILQRVRKIRMQVGARLVGNPQITRVIEDSIRVRNDVVL